MVSPEAENEGVNTRIQYTKLGGGAGVMKELIIDKIRLETSEDKYIKCDDCQRAGFT